MRRWGSVQLASTRLTIISPNRTATNSQEGDLIVLEIRGRDRDERGIRVASAGDLALRNSSTQLTAVVG
jgi:hypothetical protein